MIVLKFTACEISVEVRIRFDRVHQNLITEYSTVGFNYVFRSCAEVRAPWALPNFLIPIPLPDFGAAGLERIRFDLLV